MRKPAIIYLWHRFYGSTHTIYIHIPPARLCRRSVAQPCSIRSTAGQTANYVTTKWRTTCGIWQKPMAPFGPARQLDTQSKGAYRVEWSGVK